jgi:hypothetical protein
MMLAPDGCQVIVGTTQARCGSIARESTSARSVLSKQVASPQQKRLLTSLNSVERPVPTSLVKEVNELLKDGSHLLFQRDIFCAGFGCRNGPVDKEGTS